MSERSLREQIARIIDPWSSNQCEWASSQDNDEILREHLPKREAAFAKADAILALLNAARSEALSSPGGQGNTEAQGCGTTCAPPFANHAHELPAASAAYPAQARQARKDNL